MSRLPVDLILYHSMSDFNRALCRLVELCSDCEITPIRFTRDELTSADKQFISQTINQNKQYIRDSCSGKKHGDDIIAILEFIANRYCEQK